MSRQCTSRRTPARHGRGCTGFIIFAMRCTLLCSVLMIPPSSFLELTNFFISRRIVARIGAYPPSLHFLLPPLIFFRMEPGTYRVGTDKWLEQRISEPHG